MQALAPLSGLGRPPMQTAGPRQPQPLHGWATPCCTCVHKALHSLHRPAAGLSAKAPARKDVYVRSAPQEAAGPTSPTQTARQGAKETWQRLQLLKRQLDVAVSDENYPLAAKLRDEVQRLLSSLPLVQQYLHRQVGILRSGTQQEKLQALRAIVEAGDEVVVADVAACLSDPELSDAAYESIWALFMSHPDPEVNEMMVEGMSFMASASTYDLALAVFNKMVKKVPDFPEAYNKRATVLYTMKRFEESIRDCEVVLQLQPYHFGAASGMGLCYLMLSREPEAVAAFEQALAIHPGMKDIAKVLAELKKRLAKTAGQAGGTGAGDGSTSDQQTDG